MNLGCTRFYMSSNHFFAVGKLMAEGYGLTELDKEN